MKNNIGRALDAPYPGRTPLRTGSQPILSRAFVRLAVQMVQCRRLADYFQP